MARTALTARQKQIKELMAQDKSAGDIAKALGTTAQAIYANQSRMRAAGHLPKNTAKRNGAKRERASANGSSHETSVKITPKTIEEMIAAELAGVGERLTDIDAKRTLLNDEAEALTARRTQLSAMQEAGKPGSEQSVEQAALAAAA